MRGKKLLIGVCFAFLCLAGTAGAIRIQVGDIVVTGDGHVIPSTLPKFENAPIKLKMHGKLSTASGKLPPILKKLKMEFDEDGAVQTKGLPVCTAGKLQSTTVAAARAACPKSIIGTGHGHAVITFPDQKGIPVSSPLTFFNGPNSANRWIVYMHAYNTVPVPAAIIFKVEAKRIDNGPFGYLVETDIPKIAGGAGIPVAAKMDIGHRWRHGGKLLSYLNARCEDGKLQAQGRFEFNDGTVLSGSFLKPCKVRP